MKNNTHGGRRLGAGRHIKKQRTKTVSFRVLEENWNEITGFFYKLSIEERTEFLINLIK